VTTESVQVETPEPVSPRARSVLRMGWGVADQAVSSISNFLLGIFVAKTLGTEMLGAFSLAYVTYSVILNGARGVATDPLVVRFSGPPDRRWRRAVAEATGTSLVVGVLAGMGCVFLGLALAALIQPAAVGWAFVALGIGLPGLLVQDSWRFAFFSSGRGHGALLNDLVWTVLMVSALLVSYETGASGVGLAMLIFGGTATVAALVGLLQTRVVPRPSAARSWATENIHLGPRYLIENVTNSGASQLRAFALGAVAGLAAVGNVRGAEMLIGPFLVILFGVAQVAVPEARRAMARGSGHLLRFCLVTGLVLAGLSVLWGLVVMALLPRGLGQALLGEVWPGAQPLAPGVIVTVTAACFAVGATAGLRALGQSRRSLRAQLNTTWIYVVASCGGAWVAGAQGAVWGAALARIVASGVWWFELHHGVQLGPEETVMDQSDKLTPVGDGGPAERVAQTAPPHGSAPAAGPVVRSAQTAVAAEEDPPAAGPAPRLTLGLPTFNRASYLRESLQCLLAQTFLDFELVISDNASTDETATICTELAAQDPRIRYVRQTSNIGATANHNFVVEQARGVLFKWVSDDDLYHRDLLARCVEQLDRHPEAVCAHSMDALVDSEGRIIQNNPYELDTTSTSPVERFRSLLYGRGGNDIYGVMRTSVVTSMEPYGSFHNSDRVFVAELALQGPFVHVPDVLYYRRDHPARAERASGETRSRAANLDPRRLSESKVRLYVEYIAAYVRAIRGAPLSTSQRARCGVALAGFVASRLVPFHKVGDLDSFDPAVRDRASHARTVRLWTALFGTPRPPSVDTSSAGTRPVL
jgi:glycosyltransferase involved in cell wall biosynthesis/O-antigen/teichoic acid export membrane protein